MAVHDLSLCRSLLFLPASNPRAIEKARGLEADMIVLDLEDAVPEDQKDSARVAAVSAAAEGFGGRPVAIRINAVGHRCHGDDMVATRYSKAPYVILPKAEKERQLIGAHQVCEKPVLAMIETATGVLCAGALAPHSAGLIAGTNDLAASLRIPPGSGRAGLTAALHHIVIAARAAGVAAFDGVYNRLEDDEGLAVEAREGRSFGFDGKSVIHPAQIETANRIFSPSGEELEAAVALVAAAADGAQRYEGRMIEALHVAEARALIAKARR